MATGVLAWQHTHRDCGNNGTGRRATVWLRADAAPGPAHPDHTKRTLVYQIGDRTGQILLGPNGWQVNLPLHLTPGLNRLKLHVAEPAIPPHPQGVPVPLLQLVHPRIEPADTASTHYAYAITV